METPPQFPGAPKKSKTGLILGGLALAVVLCCCGCGGFLLYFGKDVFKNAIGFVGCGIGIGEHRDALIQYAADHKDQLPAAKTWQDDIKPYLEKMPHDPEMAKTVKIAGPNDNFCDEGAKTGITLNSAIAGKKLSSIKEQMETIALFETPGTGRNKVGTWSEPSFESSPKVVANEGRGWIRQPLKGEASIKDKRGNITPVPKNGMTAGGGSVRVSTGTTADSGE